MVCVFGACGCMSEARSRLDGRRLTSRPERASDMHPQVPNTQAFLPACLLSTACDYYGLNCFDPLVPPSAPERTLQASGQGHAIARPKGGPPRCSVPVSSTRWAASGTSSLMKPSCGGMCQNKPTHVQLCNPMRSREKKSRNISAAGARETQNTNPQRVIQER